MGTTLLHFPCNLSTHMKRYGASIAIFLIVLGILEWVIPATGVPSYVLPKPTSVVQEMFNPEKELLIHFSITSFVSVSGFMVGSLLGFVLGILFFYVKPVGDALYPWAIVSQTVPLIALAPLVVMWFGSVPTAYIVMAAFPVFFPVLVNTMQGLYQTDRDRLDLFHAYAASGWQLFWHLRLKESLPYLFGGLKVSSTLAVVGAVVSEFAGASRGLGFVIVSSTYTMETERTFAAIIAASILGTGLYALILLLERWVIFWKRPGGTGR